MSVSGGHGEAGPVAELRGKSIGELKEILERQEKLLNNKKFITKLPDQGKKIMAFTEKVRLAIAEQEQINKRKELLSVFRSEFQAKQSNVTCDMQMDGFHANKQLDRMEVKAVSANLLPEELNDNSVSYVNGKTSQGNDSGMIEILPKSTANVCSDADTLVNDLRKITLKDSHEEISSDSLQTSAVQPKNPFLPSGLRKSHFIEVIENRAMSPVCTKDKFRTNKLPSSSNCSSQCESPAEGTPKLSLEERRKQDRKHLNDITAATLPPLHHAPTQLLTLDESLALQTEQKKIYEEKHAKLAAQKLFEKINIKMVTFNPEGDSDTKYRDLRENEDYDD